MGKEKAEKLRLEDLETEEVDLIQKEEGGKDGGRLGNWKAEKVRQGDLETYKVELRKKITERESKRGRERGGCWKRGRLGYWETGRLNN